jgi:predicted nucleic acid-binding protein
VKVYLDTNCVIYLVEKNPTWLAKVVARLAHFRAANDQLAIGDLTRAECLVGPFISGDATVEASYRAFFADPDIQVLPLTAAICERAARIRAAHRFELVDALHLATAAEHGCGLFLTNDAKLAHCTDIPVEVLS